MISSVKAAFQLEIKIIQFKSSTVFQFRFESLLVDDKRIHADNFSFNFIALKCHAKTNELSGSHAFVLLHLSQCGKTEMIIG